MVWVYKAGVGIELKKHLPPCHPVSSEQTSQGPHTVTSLSRCPLPCGLSQVPIFVDREDKVERCQELSLEAESFHLSVSLQQIPALCQVQGVGMGVIEKKLFHHPRLCPLAEARYMCQLNSSNWLLRVPWTARRSNQSILKEIKSEYSDWKDWCWRSNTLSTWCKEPIHWKRPQCWERLRTGGEAGDRGWDDWMASSTQWTWVWANSRRWWRTGKPGVLQSMGLQRVGHDWATEQQQQFLSGPKEEVML